MGKDNHRVIAQHESSWNMARSHGHNTSNTIHSAGPLMNMPNKTRVYQLGIQSDIRAAQKNRTPLCGADRTPLSATDAYRRYIPCCEDRRGRSRRRRLIEARRTPDTGSPPRLQRSVRVALYKTFTTALRHKALSPTNENQPPQHQK